MEKLLKQLLGYTPTHRQVYDFKPGVRTTISTVKDALTFEEWCQRYRVSMLHDRQIIYIG